MLCRLRCLRDANCRGYSWHNQHQSGGWSMRCVILDEATSQMDQFAGIMDSSVWPTRPGIVSGTCLHHETPVNCHGSCSDEAKDPMCVDGQQTNGHGFYCSEDCRCAEGEGNCRESDSLCQPGLTCFVDAGRAYNMPRYVDVCIRKRALLSASGGLALALLDQQPQLWFAASNNCLARDYRVVLGEYTRLASAELPP